MARDGAGALPGGPPDGGWGWVVTLASFTVHTVVLGLCYSFGVLYRALLADAPFSGGDKAGVAWVGSIATCLMLLMGVVAGELVLRWGHRAVTAAGGALLAAGLLASSYAPALPVLYATYGFMCGVGFSLAFASSVMVVNTYFTTRRALAVGIAVSGSGAGTFLFAALNEHLITTAGGWRACLRVDAAIAIVLVTLSAATYVPVGAGAVRAAGVAAGAVAVGASTATKAQPELAAGGAADAHPGGKASAGSATQPGLDDADTSGGPVAGSVDVEPLVVPLVVEGTAAAAGGPVTGSDREGTAVLLVCEGYLSASVGIDHDGPVISYCADGEFGSGARAAASNTCVADTSGGGAREFSGGAGNVDAGFGACSDGGRGSGAAIASRGDLANDTVVDHSLNSAASIGVACDDGSLGSGERSSGGDHVIVAPLLPLLASVVVSPSATPALATPAAPTAATSPSPPTPAARHPRLTRREIYLSRPFLQVAGGIMLYAGALFVPYTHLAAHVVEVGFSSGFAAAIVAGLGAGSIAGRILMGRAADSRAISVLGLFQGSMLTAGAVTIALAWLGHRAEYLCFYAASFGFFAGGIVSLSPSLLIDAFGLDALPVALGASYTVQTPTVLLLPPIAGWVRAATGDYTSSWLWSGACMMLAAGFFVCFPTRLDQWYVAPPGGVGGGGDAAAAACGAGKTLDGGETGAVGGGDGADGAPPHRAGGREGEGA